MTSQKPPAPNAILFDWDHTLINPDAAIIGAFDQTLQDMATAGYPLPNDEALPLLCGHSVLENPLTRGRIMETLKEAFAEHYGPEQEAQVAALYHHNFKAASLAHSRLVTGALDTLLFLQKHSIPFAVVSQKTQSTLEAEYDKLLRPRLGDTVLIGGSPDRKSKPHPDGLVEAMDRLRLPADQRGHAVWMVGDSYYTDVAAGKAAGCTPVWFGPAAYEASTQPDTRPDVEWIPNHSAFKRLVQLAHGASLAR